jgi:hypothetical protein
VLILHENPTWRALESNPDLRGEWLAPYFYKGQLATFKKLTEYRNPLNLSTDRHE